MTSAALNMPTRNRSSRWLRAGCTLTLCAGLVCCSLLSATADDAAPPAEVPAIKFARHNVERATQAGAAAQAKVTAATEALQKAEQGLTTATAAKTAADQALQLTVQTIAQAEQAAQQLAATAKAATEAAAKVQADANVSADAKAQLVALAKEVTEKSQAGAALVAALQTAKTTGEQGVAAAAKTVTDAQAAVKTAQEQKVAVEKEAAPSVALVKQAQHTLDFYTATPPVAAPANIHLIETFKHSRSFQSCRIDPTGDYVFGGSQDNSIQRWDLLQGTQVPLAGHTSWISDFDFQPGTNLLVSGGYEGALHWWGTPLEQPQDQRHIAAHKGQLRALAFSRDGQLIATAGNDKLVRIWKAEDGSLVKELPGHGSHVYNLVFHPDGKHLVSGELLGMLKQWEMENWTQVREFDAKVLCKYDPTFKADCGGIRGIDISGDGRFLAVGGIGEVTNAFAGVGKPTVLIFDWSTGKQLHQLLPKENFQGSIWSLAFHPAGFLIGAGGGGAGGMWFWQPEQGTALFDFKLPSVAYDMSLHPDGLRLALACYDNTVRIYDLGPTVPPVK